MKAKYLILIVFLTCLFSSTVLLAQDDMAESALQVCRSIITRQMEITNFQVDTHLEINFSEEQKSIFDFVYYFQEPEMVYLETTDFVLLPTDTLRTIQPEFFKPEDYRLEFIREEADNFVVALIPLDPVQQYKVILYINPAAEMINQAEVLVKIANLEQNFSIKIVYQKVNGYSLPREVFGDLAIPTKFSHEWQIKDFREGNFFLQLENYKVNQGIPAAILKKMKQQHH